jgi:hypothetical protein
LYYALSPQDDIKPEKVQTYFDALLWALTNRDTKNIRNIAITGVYGSGKSSVIKTFQKKYKNNKELKFLNISLATFSNSNESGTYDGQPKSLQRLIELSILQQLLYREKDNILSDSRIRKIKHHTGKRVSFFTICLFLFLASLANVITGYNNYYPWDIFFQNISLHRLPLNNSSIYFISLIISIIGSIFILNKIVRLVYSIKLSKLSFQNAEIEVDKDISKSILNHYLDEILYFFEATKYNIVVIEDLDRFEQTDVFTKLREINLLLNESQKITRTIVFIYAIRDDMFKDKDRTKFFDFIIPIIPVVNKSNSGEFLLTAKHDGIIDISDNVIDDLSLFLDDTRLLYNIINEYKIYRSNLNGNLKENKLFAIIFYKNLYPNDFAELGKNEGILYAEINTKQIFIQEHIKELESKIEQNRIRIIELNALKITDIKELRTIYAFEYLKSIPDFISFFINGTICKFDNVLNDDIFEYLINDNSYYTFNRNGNIRTSSQPITTKFVEIEKRVDPTHTYKQRLEKINDYNTQSIEELKKQNEELVLEKENLISKTFAEVYNIYDNNEITDKQMQIIKILLQYGYIDEDYFDYMSLFHEGSITKKDADFIINVKMKVPTEFDYKLNQVERVIKKIQNRDETDFGKAYILNYDLFDFLLSNDMYHSLKEKVYSSLKNNTDHSLDFIDGFIAREINTNIFINELCNLWQGFWDYIETKSQYSEDKKDIYLKLIVEHVDIENIEKQNINKNFARAIERKSDFFTIMPEKEKLYTIIQKLNIKFNALDIQTLDDETFEFVCEGNYYHINSDMIILFLTYKNIFNKNTFDTQNFTTILKSDYKPLINYIDINIMEYIDNIYLKLLADQDESEETLLKLINNDSIPLEKKMLIIQKVTTKLQTLNDVNEIEIKRVLMNESKVLPTWTTIITFFHEENDVLTDEILAFINNYENAKVISATKINGEIPDEETVSNFLKTMLVNNSISDEVYALLTVSCPYWYDSLDFGNLSQNKVISLIDNTVLRVFADNFLKLKSNFSLLHIRLLEKNPEGMIVAWDTLALDIDDYLLLLKSPNLTLEDKSKICGKIPEKAMMENSVLFATVSELVFNNSDFQMTNSLVNFILLYSTLEPLKKIKIFNDHADQISNDFITSFLKQLGYPYSSIAEHGPRPKLAKNEIIEQLAYTLKNKDYISSFSMESDTVKFNTKKSQ